MVFYYYYYYHHYYFCRKEKEKEKDETKEEKRREKDVFHFCPELERIFISSSIDICILSLSETLQFIETIC